MLGIEDMWNDHDDGGAIDTGFELMGDKIDTLREDTNKNFKLLLIK